MRRWWFVLAAIVAIYIVLTVSRVLTAQPWNDEAWYATPSLSLINHGTTGTPYLETAGKFWRGINQRTYWVVPLQFFVQVPWFKLFGFSLMTARTLAMMWGLLALVCWGLIIYRLTRDDLMALLGMFLIACDYQFDSQMALGRMDAMALAFASLAILAYVELRERNLGWAIFWSQLCVVSCGLTHPTPGVPACVAILFLTLYLDRRRLRWKYLAPAAIPYLLGAAFWGWYISPSPDLFRAQFFGNVTDIDRLGGFKHPFHAIVREAGRYAGMAGFLPGMHPFYRIKSVVIAIYALSIAGVLLTPEARRNPGIRTLFWLWTVYFLCMTFYDNTKEVKYAIHIVALYDVMVAAWAVTWWRQLRFRRVIAAYSALAFVLVSAGGTLYTSIAKDDYHREFLPAARFLEKSASHNDLILASSEFGFALGFDRNIVDDDSFTYDSRKVPAFIVLDRGYMNGLAHSKDIRPEIFNYFMNLLDSRYKLVYSAGNYRIFERSDKVARHSDATTGRSS